MHLSVAQPETSGTAPPRRLITASQTNSLAWVVYRELDDFLFEVSPLKVDANDPMPPALYTSPANFSTAHKAEKAAKSWCEAYEPSATPHVGQNLGDVVRRMEVSGWLIEVCAGERGGYVGVHIDLDNGEVGTDRTSTYETADAALDAARTWADANPTRAEQENRRASADMDAALAGPDMSTPFELTGKGNTVASLVQSIGRSDRGRTRPRLPCWRRRSPSSPRSPAPSEADELMVLAARKQKLLDDIEDLKLELKSVEKARLELSLASFLRRFILVRSPRRLERAKRDQLRARRAAATEGT